MNKKFAKVHTLTFDLFGTVLDLTGGLVSSLREYFMGIIRDAAQNHPV